MLRKTTLFEKLFTSAIGALLVLLISAPLLLIWGFSPLWKLSVIFLFFLYNVLFLMFNNNRCLGMIIIKTNWAQQYSKSQHFIWIVLYTASFSTLFWWSWFPFDLFLINMLLIQLPTVLLTGTTFHGWLSGKMETVKEI